MGDLLWQALGVAGVFGLGAARMEVNGTLISVVLLVLAAMLRHNSEAAAPDPVTMARRRSERLEEAAWPLRWSFLPTTGALTANTKEAIASSNDVANLKFLVMHRPTHDKALEKSGQYPYSWHFAQKKRTWEVRVQVQFKKDIPQGKFFFGLEMQQVAGHTKSAMVSNAQSLLLGMVRGAIGNEFYQTAGNPEDPEEAPCFVMPLWAIDQMIVSEPGQEPNLNSDLTGVGTRRTDGMKEYIRYVDDVTKTFSADKVYTFCFWGVSQVVDVINWELKIGFSMDANKLCGASPINVVGYFLQEDAKDPRHTDARKTFLFKVALWSTKRAPEPEMLRQVVGDVSPALDETKVPEPEKKKGFIGQVKKIARNMREEVMGGGSSPGGKRQPLLGRLAMAACGDFSASSAKRD